MRKKDARNEKQASLILTRIEESNILVIPHTQIRTEDFLNFYYEVIERLFRSDEILLSQFIDVGQHYIDVKRHCKEISNLYDVEIIATDEILERNPIQSNAEIYYLHIRGRMNASWLRHMVGFGGTSLSTVIWQGKGKSSFDNLFVWNRKLTEWFYGKSSSNKRIHELIDFHTVFSMVVDGELWILFPERKVDEIMQLVDLIFSIYGYSSKVEIKG